MFEASSKPIMEVLPPASAIVILPPFVVAAVVAVIDSKVGKVLLKISLVWLSHTNTVFIDEVGAEVISNLAARTAVLEICSAVSAPVPSDTVFKVPVTPALSEVFNIPE